jgi:hypothetical protein
MAILKHVVPAAGGRESFAIYAETANINYFIKTALVPSTSAGATNKQIAVSGYSRRQYPGDTSSANVGGSSREILIDPSRKSGNGLPGRRITLVSASGLPNEERRSFTLKGRWVDFHSWLTVQAKFQLFAYNNTGARSTIVPAITE